MSSTPSHWSRTAFPTRAAAQPTLVPSARKARARRLNRQELRRRICHMAPGMLPFLLWPISHKDPLSPLLMQIILGLFVVIVAGFFLKWSRIARADVGTNDRAAAILGYAVTVLATILIFPAHLECGLAVLAVLAFGDGAATLIGQLVQGPRLPWNREKTVAGFAGFVAVGIPLTTLIYWGESNNLQQAGISATMLQALCVAFVGVMAGAVAESLPVRLNDNLRVGVASAIGTVAAHAVLFGV